MQLLEHMNFEALANRWKQLKLSFLYTVVIDLVCNLLAAALQEQQLQEATA